VWQHSSRTDIVGLKDKELIAVELKQGCRGLAFNQAYRNQCFSDKSYVAVAIRPRAKTVARYKEHHIGIILVSGDAVSVISEAEQNNVISYRKDDTIKILERFKNNTVAGLPCQSGVGEAQECLKAVMVYREKNPDAPWRAIFREVKNHYASPASMRQSLEKLQFFRMLKEKYAGKTCGDCERRMTEKGYCSAKNRNRQVASKACINFVEIRKRRIDSTEFGMFG
jgi:hypothetical protein